MLKREMKSESGFSLAIASRPLQVPKAAWTMIIIPNGLRVRESTLIIDARTYIDGSMMMTNPQFGFLEFARWLAECGDLIRCQKTPPTHSTLESVLLCG